MYESDSRSPSTCRELHASCLEKFRSAGVLFNKTTKKLLDAQEHLRHSYELKTKAQEKTSDVMNKLKESRKNVQKMLHEKRNLEMELENKEQESQLLCTMQEEDAHKQVPLENIEKGKREIQSLKEEL